MYMCAHVSVSRQPLTLLASLFQEDYVKWKGSLFFRFISTLLDEELRVFGKEEVRREGGREGGSKEGGREGGREGQPFTKRVRGL